MLQNENDRTVIAGKLLTRQYHSVSKSGEGTKQ
jgi:hypothetical protein